ncbi:MAG TPA: Dabb family protein [Verrucomicrobiales bacterium]|jgi:hypothetical protein|nr:Dabb family protein [Verrucomicrobiales bacterium]
MKPVSIICAIAALLCSACQTTTTTGRIQHVVVFWLKDHGNAAQRAKIIETSETFRNIPGVVSVTAGPCIPSPRPIVDSSFDVAVTLTFSSQAGLQRYVEHPLHKAAVSGVLKPLVKKTVVYDFGIP